MNGDFPLSLWPMSIRAISLKVFQAQAVFICSNKVLKPIVVLPLTFENGGIIMWQELLDISKTITNWETQPRILKLYWNKLGLFPKPWASLQLSYTKMQSLHVMCVKWCWPLYMYYYHVSMTTLLDRYTQQHCTLFICHILLMSPYPDDVEGWSRLNFQLPIFLAS